jgi:hypothetical protein
VHIEQLSGEVLDPEGASIANAEILLFDSTNTLVARL